MPRILYIQYTNPAGYPPLEHSSRILADAGWHVLFLGTAALGAGALRFPPHDRIGVRYLRFQTAGWLQKLHYVWFCLWCLGWTLRARPDWIYASDLLACPPALFIGISLRIPLLYHEHDSPTRRTSSLFMKACLFARKRCARRAKVCILPNEERARHFAAETAPTHRVEVVWNCPSRTEVLAVGKRELNRGLRLLYHGSIVPDRLPLSIFDAMSILPDNVSLTVVGYETVGSKGYLDVLRNYARRLNIIHRVEVVGAVARRDELLDIGRSCDVGLALVPLHSEDSNIQAMTGASNKPFDYLACGLAVLVSDLPDWHDLFVRSGYGLSCDPSLPASIAAALQQFYEHPAERSSMGERGRRRVDMEWNYEWQFQQPMKLLSSDTIPPQNVSYRRIFDVFRRKARTTRPLAQD